MTNLTVFVTFLRLVVLFFLWNLNFFVEFNISVVVCIRVVKILKTLCSLFLFFAFSWGGSTFLNKNKFKAK